MNEQELKIAEKIKELLCDSLGIVRVDIGNFYFIIHILNSRRPRSAFSFRLCQYTKSDVFSDQYIGISIELSIISFASNSSLIGGTSVE